MIHEHAMIHEDRSSSPCTHGGVQVELAQDRAEQDDELVDGDALVVCQVGDLPPRLSKRS